jgi:outer membrane protein TolC
MGSMKNGHRSITLFVIALASSGCSTTPPTAMKPAELPASFAVAPAAGAPQDISAKWWQSFSSVEMRDLVATARTQNLDLVAAAARVLQAQAQSGAAASSLFPDINLSGSAGRQGSKTPLATSNTFGASLGASYELDFWGLAQDKLRAARNSARAAIYAKDVVELTATANTADTYMAVLALRERIAIANKSVDAARRIMAITQAKVTNGVSSNLDLAQQKALLAVGRTRERSALRTGDPAGSCTGRLQREGSRVDRHRSSAGVTGHTVIAAATPP